MMRPAFSAACNAVDDNWYSARVVAVQAAANVTYVCSDQHFLCDVVIDCCGQIGEKSISGVEVGLMHSVQSIAACLACCSVICADVACILLLHPSYAMIVNAASAMQVEVNRSLQNQLKLVSHNPISSDS